MCANLPETDLFYENENINYNLESLAPLNCDVNSPMFPINNDGANINAYSDDNLTYSNFLLCYKDKLATTTNKNSSITNSNNTHNNNNHNNHNNNHYNNLLSNDISQMNFLLDYPSTLNEPQFAVNCKDIYKKDISTPSSLVSSLPSANFSLSLSNSPSPPPPSSSSLRQEEITIPNASTNCDAFADPTAFGRETLPLTQELTLDNLNNQLNYPDFTINAIEQDPIPSSFSSSSSSSESTTSSSRRSKACHDSFSNSSPSSSSESKKISDSRLSAEGLAKVLNLESPEEALRRERFILGIFQNELNYPLGYKTWIRDTTKEYRTKLINQLHERVKVKYPEYDQSILETIIRRGTYYMMQSRLRRERRMKLKERKRTT
ncbi:YBL029W [Saccharomyces arboricola H-6]|uniref:YBL029W n=1 Tax=Saccharomyces arboricola (strain H-6 / AS 2.3317 / CBS 10644) TaxID=1160507 RepID=J8Q4N5_SACAR|nr:YBL029W [Saccharomyces arboricola H-6]